MCSIVILYLSIVVTGLPLVRVDTITPDQFVLPLRFTARSIPSHS